MRISDWRSYVCSSDLVAISLVAVAPSADILVPSKGRSQRRVRPCRTHRAPHSRLSSRHFKLSLPGSRPGNPCPSLTPDLSGEARCRGRMGPRDKPEGDNWSGLARHHAACISGVRRLYAPAGVIFPEGAVTGMQGRSITLFELLGFKVRADVSWLFLAVLVTWSLAPGVFPLWYEGLSAATYWWMGVAGMLGLVFSLVFHELSQDRKSTRLNSSH